MGTGMTYIFKTIEEKLATETSLMARFVLNSVIWEMRREKKSLTIDDLAGINRRVAEVAILDPVRREKIGENIEKVINELIGSKN